MYVLSYQAPNFKNVRAVVVESESLANRYIAALPDGACGLRVNDGVDSPAIKKLSLKTILILHNALTYPSVDKFDDFKIGRNALYRVLKEAAVPPEPGELAPEPVATQSAESSAPATESSAAETSLEDVPVNTGTSSDNSEEASMAAKKTAKKTKAKKTPKAKSAPKVAKEKKAKDGLPRAGSKKAELLRLLQRSNGATMKEMLDSTGWKACLGTAKAVTLAAKQKFRHEKGEGDKPSRWYAE